MGLLSSTSGRQKVIPALQKYGFFISICSYIGGIIWMFALAHHELSAKNYFSENQLLPGLVETYFSQLRYPYAMYNKFRQDCHKQEMMPYEDIVAEFNSFGLDTHIQPFAVKSKALIGTNIYGVYRSPRASGVESIVLNVPYNGCNSTGSLALMLALSKYFRSQTYWAKDIIFLFTEHGLYGMKAWLEAYHHDISEDIDTTDLTGHGGSVQAAIVLDFSKDFVNYFDLLIEGVNGQLPNLDVINLVFRIGSSEGVPIKFKHQSFLYQSNNDFNGNLETLLRMMVTHSTGYPTGNHGLFYKYRIEAVTLKGVDDAFTNNGRRANFEAVGRLIEGMFRSINNMLEHFHQSFFLYVLPNTHRYISIGLYMPPLGCLLLPLVICLFKLWIDIFKMDQAVDTSKSCDHIVSRPFRIWSILLAVLGRIHVKSSVTLSVLMNWFSIKQILLSYMLSACLYIACPIILKQAKLHNVEDCQLFVALCVTSWLSVTVSRLARHEKNSATQEVLKLFWLFHTSTLIVVLSIFNFSLAFFVAAFYVPMLMLLCHDKQRSRLYTMVQLACAFLSSPIIALFIIAVVSLYSAQHEHMLDNLLRTAFRTLADVIYYDLSNVALGVYTRNVIYVSIFPLWISITTLTLP